MSNPSVGSKLVDELRTVARRLTATEQGCDMDDLYMLTTDEVYNIGCDDGTIMMARKVLTDLEIEWQDNVDAEADL
jgi:hypothetical protein